MLTIIFPSYLTSPLLSSPPISILVLDFLLLLAVDSVDKMASCADVTDNNEDQQFPPNIQVETEKADAVPSLTALHESRRQKEASRLTAMARFERYALKYEASGKDLLQATNEVHQIVSDNNKSVNSNTDWLLG